MSLVKSKKIGNTTIEIYSNDISSKEQKQNIKSLYDEINRVAKKLRQQNIDVSDLFYNEKELKKVELI